MKAIMNEKDIVLMFDLDGTLLDTNALIYESIRHTFRTYWPEKELTEEELLVFLGPPLRDTFSLYFDKELVDEVLACYRKHNWDYHGEYVTIYPTVKETLNYFKQHSYPMAVVTSKLTEVAKLGLDLFDLSDYFGIVVGVEDVKEVKPAPEGIYNALDYFGKNRGIMIGDNMTDIVAGKNAGVLTAGVEWTVKPLDSLRECNPDIMLRQMKDLIPFVEKVLHTS